MNQQGTWAAFARAEQLIEWKRYQEALRELEHILRKEPDNPDALALIARVYHLQDEYENALYWARMALKQEPDHQLAWFVRVCVFYETDKEKEFDEAVHNALRIDPYEPHYYFLMANRWNKKGKYYDAKEFLRRAFRQLERQALPYSVNRRTR